MNFGSRSVEPACVAPRRNAADLSGLPQAVVETITVVELLLQGKPMH